MKKPHDERTQIDIGAIVSYCKEIPLFKELSIASKDLPEVCEFLTHEMKYDDDIIVNYHKSYDQCWIILEGSVNFEVHVKEARQKDIISIAKEFGHDGRDLLN